MGQADTRNYVAAEALTEARLECMKCGWAIEFP